MGKILIADDSKAIRCMLINVLGGAGHEVTEAGDGLEAMDKAVQERFNLVISDVNMPNMDGFTLAKQLRQLEGYRFIPIIFLTTEDADEFKLKGREAGATAWITKPFSPKKLIEVVSKVTGLW